VTGCCFRARGRAETAFYGQKSGRCGFENGVSSKFAGRRSPRRPPPSVMEAIPTPSVHVQSEKIDHCI